MPLDPRPRFAVSHYLFDFTVYRKWFIPQLNDAFGPLFPLILIGAFAAVIYVAIRSRNVILRVLAVGALVTAVVYVFTPLTAAGTEGSPTGFFTNTRYLTPGLVLALAMLPLARPLRAPDKRAWWTLIALAAVFAVTVVAAPHVHLSYIIGTLFLVLALVWVPAGLHLLSSRRRVSRGVVAAAAAAVVLLGVLLGRGEEVYYYSHHYTQPRFFLGGGGPRRAYAFARDQHDKRIGIAGSGEIFFGQYGYYGADLSNYVQYIGVPGPYGAYRLATNCPEFRRRVNAGHYDYLVVSRYTQDARSSPYSYPIYAWLKTDPALKQIIAESRATPEPDYVFKVNGELEPAGCTKTGRSPRRA